jgi:hypothetical protein
VLQAVDSSALPYSPKITLYASIIVTDSAWANDRSAALISSFCLHVRGTHAGERPAKLRIGNQGSAPSAHRNLETNSLATLVRLTTFSSTDYSSCQILVFDPSHPIAVLLEIIRLQSVGSDPVPPQPFCQPQPPVCGQSGLCKLQNPAVIEAEDTQKTSCGIPALTGPACELPVDTVLHLAL